MSWRQGSDRPISTIPEVGAAPPTGPPSPALPPVPPDGPPPLAPWRRVVLGVLFVVLAGGIIAMVVIRQSDGDDQATAPPLGSVPVQQTTVASTPAQSDQPPPLLNTGDDWTAMVQSFEDYLYWLARHPNPDLLLNINHPLDPLLADSKNALAKFASGEWHYDPDPRPPIVESVRFNGTIFEGTQALLFVTYGPTDRYRIVDRAGDVVRDDPATASRKVILTLARDPGDPGWRVLKGVPV